MIFQNASDAFRRLNPHLANSGTPSELERNPGNAALAAPQAESRDEGRVLVRVESVRKRLIDPDNLCAKYVIDCCRYAGLLRDDSEAEIILETRQRKAAKGEEEHTVIELSRDSTA